MKKRTRNTGTDREYQADKRKKPRVQMPILMCFIDYAQVFDCVK